MDRLEENESKSSKTKPIKSDSRCGFPMTLNKIEEIDETNSKTSEKIISDKNGNLKLKEDIAKELKNFNIPKVKVRPRSAGSLSKVSFVENNLKKRPRSSSTLLLAKRFEGERIKKIRKRPKSAGGDPFEIRDFDSEGSKWKDMKSGSYRSLMGVEDNSCWSSNTCDFCLCGCVGGKGEWIEEFGDCVADKYQTRKCRSNPNFSKTTLEKCQKGFQNEKDFRKFKRSLKLLGFEMSDFGIYNTTTKNFTNQSPKKCCSTFSTKLTTRSISLDSLRNTIRKAWVYDCLDDSHRRMMSQAAYEQWYFKKEAELSQKRKEEKIKKLKMKEKLEMEFDKKKKKAEEEFRKWTQRKKLKRKDKTEDLVKKQGNIFGKLKTKEESENAFLKWKKQKDKELEKKLEERRKEEEKKLETERQKKEKKAEAEKAFQQWVLKLEESKNREAEKKMKLRKKQEEMERRKEREKGSEACFLSWKALKDKENRKRIKMQREAMRIAQEERLAQMEERMYEAEQAFEEWLEKIDERHKQYTERMLSLQKKVPWLPV